MESPSDVHTFIADEILMVRSSNNLKTQHFIRLQEAYLQSY